jgi:hypothetical protein
MTLSRAVVYVGGASLLAAWFSSAASLSLNRGGRGPGAAVDRAESSVDQLARGVQQQSRRLRERLAAPPRAPEPRRNPFAFREPARPAFTASRVERTSVPAAPVESPEPVLSLIGVAEHKRPDSILRTAMIATAGDELLMVSAGDSVLQRYRVHAVSADAVELADLTTGRVRRLSLQLP